MDRRTFLAATLGATHLPAAPLDRTMTEFHVPLAYAGTRLRDLTEGLERATVAALKLPEGSVTVQPLGSTIDKTEKIFIEGKYNGSAFRTFLTHSNQGYFLVGYGRPDVPQADIPKVMKQAETLREQLYQEIDQRTKLPQSRSVATLLQRPFPELTQFTHDQAFLRLVELLESVPGVEYKAAIGSFSDTKTYNVMVLGRHNSHFDVLTADTTESARLSIGVNKPLSKEDGATYEFIDRLETAQKVFSTTYQPKSREIPSMRRIA